MDRRDTILIVDDVEINRAILRGLFERDYNLLEAENGEQAMLLLEQYHNVIAAVLLDVVMPIKDGYQVLTEMGDRALLAEVPVVVITAEGSAENEVRALDLGASDIIMKPFEPYVVKRRVRNTVELSRHRLHLEELVDIQARSLRESNEVMVDALSSVIEYRSVESGQHIRRIRMFTKILLENVMHCCQEYSLDQRRVDIISSSSAMHDIGKIAIPDAILNKPGPLTPEEFEVMKTHSMKGCEILSSLDRMSDKDYLRHAYNICRWHHERWDGQGYPDGLKGDNIPVCAQVVGIADAYDALTTDRVYKRAFPHEQAYNMILNGDCGQFSPKLLECFKHVRDAFEDLARQYADGRSPKADTVGMIAPILRRSSAVDTLQLSQMKYYTLMHYLDSTVMEVEHNSGVYHVVYLHSQDFELLRTGSCYNEAVQNFARGAVHPGDQALLMNTLVEYVQHFFQEGVLRRSDQFRVINRATGTYRWCRSTLLRVDVGDPRQHRTLLVVSEAGESPQKTIAPPSHLEDGVVLRDMLGGMQKRRNDRYLTLLETREDAVDLTGYTGREIRAQFENRFINMICPADREEVTRQMREQLQRGSMVELEYRVNTKSGQQIWVLDKSQLVVEPSGDAHFCSLLLDVTQSKTAQEELRLTLERHRIIMEQSQDIIFEWNIRKDQVIYSENWKKKFGYEPIRDRLTERVPLASHICPDDVPGFTALTKELSSGVPYGETVLRIAKADGHYLWCKIRATVQFDGDHTPIKAVGTLVDVDDEKRANLALIDRAEQDALTKLYNKSAIRQQVDRYLEGRISEDRGAMLIIDLDNFKQVNDRYGHMFGDAVLTEISSEIRKLFRSGDAISRIGGDEFLVFMRCISGVELVEERAKKILEAFDYLFQETMDDTSLSCSIGISLCPEDGETYQDLFQRADMALYEAKRQGKNRFVRYEKSAMGRSLPVERETAVNSRIDSDESDDRPDNLLQRAFRELYEAEDVEIAVRSILAMVGTQFKLSRCYVFEVSRNGTECQDTFEWCNDGIPSGLHTVHPIESESLGGHYPDNFNERGLFYCPDVSRLPEPQREILRAQGIRSMLQCAIRDNGKFWGYVGFDDCKMRRMWNREQIAAITFISEVLSTSLLKKRAQQQAMETARDLRAVLDNQNSYVYVIHPESHRILYINALTHEMVPRAKVGMCCYQAFMDRTSPCIGCPMQNIRQVKSCTSEMYNARLDLWTLADAALINWGGEEQCMLSCRDITAYKRDVPTPQSAPERDDRPPVRN